MGWLAGLRPLASGWWVAEAFLITSGPGLDVLRSQFVAARRDGCSEGAAMALYRQFHLRAGSCTALLEWMRHVYQFPVESGGCQLGRRSRVTVAAVVGVYGLGFGVTVAAVCAFAPRQPDRTKARVGVALTWSFLAASSTARCRAGPAAHFTSRIAFKVTCSRDEMVIHRSIVDRYVNLTAGEVAAQPDVVILARALSPASATSSPSMSGRCRAIAEQFRSERYWWGLARGRRVPTAARAYYNSLFAPWRSAPPWSLPTYPMTSTGWCRSA
jgi:hypothetical protein